MDQTFDFDHILNNIGGGGRFQILAFIATCFHGAMVGFLTFQGVYISYTPQFRCNAPPLDNNTVYPGINESKILKYTTPLKKGEYDGCKRYGYNLTDCTGDLNCVNTSAKAIPCDKGYHYDKSMFTMTTVTEFNLVCDRGIYFTVESSMYMGAAFFGSLTLGYLSDIYGRKPVLLLTTLFTLIFNGILVITHNFILYGFCRFVYSVSITGTYIVAFIYVLEIVGTKYRDIFGVGYQVCYPVGYMMWSPVAYLWRDWHQMQIATAVLCIPSVIFVAIFPESPCWLISKHRIEEAKSVSTIIATINGRKDKLNEDLWTSADKLEREVLSDADSVGNLILGLEPSYFALFHTRRIRIISIILMFLWLSCALVYNGLSFNSAELPGNLFVNNIITGCCEAAACILCIYILKCFGRKSTLCATFCLTGLALAVSTFLIEFSHNKEITSFGGYLAIAGRTSISVAYSVVYIITGEVYSTDIRGNASSIVGLTSSIGSMTYPFVLMLHNSIPWLPGFIMGGVSIVAGAIVLYLPETKNLPLLETMHEAEEFYAGRRQPAIG